NKAILRFPQLRKHANYASRHSNQITNSVEFLAEAETFLRPPPGRCRNSKMTVAIAIPPRAVPDSASSHRAPQLSFLHLVLHSRSTQDKTNNFIPKKAPS